MSHHVLPQSIPMLLWNISIHGSVPGRLNGFGMELKKTKPLRSPFWTGRESLIFVFDLVSEEFARENQFSEEFSRGDHSQFNTKITCSKSCLPAAREAVVDHSYLRLLFTFT